MDCTQINGFSNKVGPGSMSKGHRPRGPEISSFRWFGVCFLKGSMEGNWSELSVSSCLFVISANKNDFKNGHFGLSITRQVQPGGWSNTRYRVSHPRSKNPQMFPWPFPLCFPPHPVISQAGACGGGGYFWNMVCVPACWVAQSCLTLCDSMDCGLPDSSVHGIFQARILEWVAISSRSSWLRYPTLVYCVVMPRSLPLMFFFFPRNLIASGLTFKLHSMLSWFLCSL